MNSNNSNKIKLVVVNEHTLAYIHPITPNTYSTIYASVLKGATSGNHAHLPIFGTDSIRLASEADFKAFNVCFDGYKTDIFNMYEYQQ